MSDNPVDGDIQVSEESDTAREERIKEAEEELRNIALEREKEAITKLYSIPAGYDQESSIFHASLSMPVLYSDQKPGSPLDDLILLGITSFDSK